MSVELAGLPGSGKSTLFRAARATLIAQGLELAEPPARANGEAEGIVRHRSPVLWRRSLRVLDRVTAARAHDPEVDLERFARNQRRLWFESCCRVQDARRSPGLYLFEEAAVHNLWRLIFFLRQGERSPRAALGLARWVPRCTLAVHVVTTTETARRRIEGKASRGPINRMLQTADSTAPMWRQGEGDYLRLLRPPGGTEVVTLDNEQDAAAARNTRALARIVGEVGGGGARR